MTSVVRRVAPEPPTPSPGPPGDLWAAPTSTGPAGEPAAVVLDDVAGLRPRLGPDHHQRLLAGLDEIGTASTGRSVPGMALAPHQPRDESSTDSAVPALLTDLVVTWDLPVSTVAAALVVSGQQVGRWRAGEPPADVELARLRALHDAVAEVVGDRIGGGARLRLTRPRGRLGPSHLNRIAGDVRRHHPTARPRPSARSLLLGVDGAAPVAGELVVARAVENPRVEASHE